MRHFVQSLTLGVLLGASAFAAGFSPLTVAGYNFDGIVERTAVPPYSGAAQSLDPLNNALFELGLPGTTAGGLPQGGLFTFTTNSNTYSFQLGPYGANNLLRINPTGTLTLTTPAKFTTLAILGFSTNDNSPGALEMLGSATLGFTDTTSSTYTGTVDLSDWYATSPSNPNVVTGAMGGTVNITSATALGAFQATPGTGPKFYVSLITLSSGDASKSLSSVTFGGFPFGGNTYQFVMALAGPTPVVIPPATVPVLSGWAFAVLGILLVTVAASMLRPFAKRSKA